MGRYSAYIDIISQIKASRKTIGLSIFNVIIDNSKLFTPGDQLEIYPWVGEAIQTLTTKGYDFLFITGQPSKRSRDISIDDFENIIGSLRYIVSDLGGTVRGAYYTPVTNKNDPYVKPNTGMFERAENEGHIKWKESFFIGCDKNDVKAATSISTTPILISSNPDTTNNDVQTFENILEFAKAI